MLKYADLTPEQRDGITFIYEGDATMLMADVGTGKTVIALTAINEMLTDGVIAGALVVAPKNVCLDAWANEYREWAHLRDMGPPAVLTGLPPARRTAVIETRPPVLVCNYDILPWLMETYPDGVPGCDMLVCDEIDKLKDHTSKRFKGGKRKTSTKTVRVPGVKTWRNHFKIVVGMTGTPRPKHLLNLWAQMYVVDGGASLGVNYYRFRDKYFYQADWAGFKYDIWPENERRIYNAVENTCFRIAKKEGRGRPVVRELPVTWVDLPPDLVPEYKRLERDYMLTLKPPTGDATGDVVEADNAGVLYGKLKQMAQGFLYYYADDDIKKVHRKVWSQSAAKYAALDSLVSELQGQQLMVVYNFQHQLAELQARYGARMRHLGDGVSAAEFKENIAMWNTGDLEILAMHPMSAGHGLNLQKSGACHICVLTMPESAGLYEQVVGRLARTGNTSPTVFVHYILCRGTVDVDRLAVVKGEVESQADLLAYMEARQ